jgi:hypothetical protein
MVFENRYTNLNFAHGDDLHEGRGVERERERGDERGGMRERER